jgi:hypothetical protein
MGVVPGGAGVPGQWFFPGVRPGLREVGKYQED